MGRVLLVAVLAGCAPTTGLDPADVLAPPRSAEDVQVDADTAALPFGPGPAACADPDGGWCEHGEAIGLADLPSHGRGLLVADFDNDGWDDVFRCGSGAVVGGTERAKLFMNRGDGTFYTADVGIDPAATQDCWGVAAADVDQDRDTDLLVLPGGYLSSRPLALFRNDLATTGRFTDVSASAGLERTERPWWAGAFADLDGDHCVDLVAVARTGRPSLYRSRCDGTFVEEGVARGLALAFDSDPEAPPVEEGRTPVPFDYDLDGDLDLYVGGMVHEHGLFRNDGGHLVDVTRTAFPEGLLWHTTWGDRDPFVQAFTASVSDFDQDGWPDLYLGRQNEPDQVAFNQHDGTFRLLGPELGLAKLPFDEALGRSIENTMGSTITDIDLDGWPDVLVGPGTMQFVTGDYVVAFCSEGPPADASVPVRYHRCSDPFRDGHGRQRTHGIVSADFDRDGRLELMWIFGGDPYADARRGKTSAFRSFVYEDGRAEPPRTVAVQVRGTDGDLEQVGARVELRAGGRDVVRFVTAAQGYQSTISPHMMLPIGDATEAELVVRWPDGTTTTRTVVPGQRLTVWQPGGGARPVVLPQPPEAGFAQDRVIDWNPPRPPVDGPTCDPVTRQGATP